VHFLCQARSTGSTFQCQANSKMRRYIGMRAVGVILYFQTLRSHLRLETARIVQLCGCPATKHPQPPQDVSPLHASILEFQLRLPSCVFKVQSDGSPQFGESMQILDDAKAREQALGELWPGEYVIHNEETGERISITASGWPVLTSNPRWANDCARAIC
jgi:hypothetical protein